LQGGFDGTAQLAEHRSVSDPDTGGSNPRDLAQCEVEPFEGFSATTGHDQRDSESGRHVSFARGADYSRVLDRSPQLSNRCAHVADLTQSDPTRLTGVRTLRWVGRPRKHAFGDSECLSRTRQRSYG